MLDHVMMAEDLALCVHGALELEQVDGGLAPLRLPAWTRSEHADGGIDRVSAQTSGVRLRARTAARTVTLDATFTRTASRVHPARPFSLVAETPAFAQHVTLDEGDILVEASDRTAVREPGARSCVRFDLDAAAGERVVTMWLPASTACVLHAVRADAPLHPAPQKRPRWIHHGSSISHGSDLDDPRGPWPQQVARRLDLDLVNMGFAGNAMLDPFVARAIARAPAELISVSSESTSSTATRCAPAHSCPPFTTSSTSSETGTHPRPSP